MDPLREIRLYSDDDIRFIAVDGIRRLNLYLDFVFREWVPDGLAGLERDRWISSTVVKFLEAVRACNYAQNGHHRHVEAKEDGVQIGSNFISIPNCTKEVAHTLSMLVVWASSEVMLRALVDARQAELSLIDDMAVNTGVSG